MTDWIRAQGQPVRGGHITPPCVSKLCRILHPREPEVNLWRSNYSRPRRTEVIEDRLPSNWVRITLSSM